MNKNIKTKKVTQYRTRLFTNKINRRAVAALFIISTVLLCYTTITVSAHFKEINKNYIANTNIIITHNEVNEVKLYKCLKIKKGDSLWQIAETYYNKEYYNNYEDYIKEVKNINHLNDDNITEGNYITIPYYEANNVYIASD